ncbi:hypothetical protein U1Q18_050120 [Sarracenia purpurea var. burkii]
MTEQREREKPGEGTERICRYTVEAIGAMLLASSLLACLDRQAYVTNKFTAASSEADKNKKLAAADGQMYTVLCTEKRGSAVEIIKYLCLLLIKPKKSSYKWCRRRRGGADEPKRRRCEMAR